MIHAMFDSHIWRAVPFSFWSFAAFVLGTVVGSFLNVCIHRMPLGLSIVSPPSHCPHCKYSIPWYLNVPLVTWLYLRGKCRNCGNPISIRYFLVELLTGVTFLACWLRFGHQSAGLAIVYAVFLSGLIAGTFMDFEHMIIADEITIGGIAAGFACSLLVPALQGQVSRGDALKQSAFGIVLGAGLIYSIVRLGKLFLGRQKLDLPPDSKIVFTETALQLPDREVPYEDLFYRRSDTIELNARTVELADRCYKDVLVRLTPVALHVGDETLNPEEVPHLEAVTGEIVLPREVMGPGDVKLMAAIGAFLGWKGVVFTLAASSVLGSAVGVTAIVLKKETWSSRIAYVPYMSLAAAIWIFGGENLIRWWLSQVLKGH